MLNAMGNIKQDIYLLTFNILLSLFIWKPFLRFRFKVELENKCSFDIFIQYLFLLHFFVVATHINVYMLCGFFKKKRNFTKKKLLKKRKYYYEKCYVMSSEQKDKLNVLFKKRFAWDCCKIFEKLLAVDFEYSNSSLSNYYCIYQFIYRVV